HREPSRAGDAGALDREVAAPGVVNRCRTPLENAWRSNRLRAGGELVRMNASSRLVGSSRRSPRSRTMPRRDLAHLSDEAVVALTARSDDVALAELYDRYGRAAYALALRVLRDEALAEDAVQEAFLAIWRGASRFIPERAKASTWIMTLVH